MLSHQCDMFVFSSSVKICIFYPGLSLKDTNINEYLEPYPDWEPSLYILECSVSQENLIENSDPFTNTQEGECHLLFPLSQ